MSCCGANRAALRVAGTPAARAPARSAQVRLRWRRRVTAAVDGPVTRTRYQVSAEAPVIAVDPRDASGLLRTGFFERLG
jgi:hypothetical protein